MEPLEAMDKIDPLEAMDKIEPAELIEASDPTERTDPAESTEPSDPADRAEPADRHDSADHRDPRERYDIVVIARPYPLRLSTCVQTCSAKPCSTSSAYPPTSHEPGGHRGSSARRL